MMEGQQHGDRLKRGLKNRHIQLIALGGAIGTGLFLGSGKSISLTGPSIIFVYILVGVIMFFLMLFFIKFGLPFGVEGFV